MVEQTGPEAREPVADFLNVRSILVAGAANRVRNPDTVLNLRAFAYATLLDHLDL